MRFSAIAFAVVMSVVVASGCTQQTTQPDEVNGGQALQTYTTDEVSIHDSSSDCWLILHGKVYDVTGFITSHPGGSAILEGCGKDATELFETRPMGSGTPHSERARKISDSYYIGDLKA